VRRYEIQLWEPDKGGWRTVLTAVDPGMLRISARTLAWQTQKPVRLLGPDGVVPHDEEVATAAEAVAGVPNTASSQGG
jgi:hypothetical protein